MPHLYLEYTANTAGFDAQAALLSLNAALAHSGEFDEIDIKSRATELTTYTVGTAPNRAFVHARLALLQGRDEQTKLHLSQLVLQVLMEQTQSLQIPDLQLCAEIQDIERPSYAKHHVRHPIGSSRAHA